MTIDLFKVFMSEEAVQAASSTLRTGFIGQGKKVDEFEAALRDYLQVERVVTTNSATSAEHLVFHTLIGMGLLQEGDGVLTTSETCSATNWPILLNRLRPVWVDVDPETINMDLLDLERKIDSTTKVIYLTNWGGYPFDLDKIQEIRKRTFQKFGFCPFLIQDCAHALGAKYKGKSITDYGICTFSFQAIKHVTSINGGAITFDSWDDLHNELVLGRWYGIDRSDDKRTDFRCENDIKKVGWKFHLDDVSASVGIENLKYADWIIWRHKDNANFYDENLKDIPGVTLLRRDPWADSPFWIYSLLVEDRQNFMRKLKDRGIASSQVHERNDKHSCVKEYQRFLPNLDKVIGRLVNIPVHWGVSEEDRELICNVIKEGW